MSRGMELPYFVKYLGDTSASSSSSFPNYTTELEILHRDQYRSIFIELFLIPLTS